MILILPEAVIDEKQKAVIFRIQDFTTAENVTLTVTRGHSSPYDQLAIIEKYAKQHNCLFEEFQPGVLADKLDVWIDGEQKSVYPWQQTWSMLLHLYSLNGGKRGALVNPPMIAECLFDYIVGDHNKKGELIQPSPHIVSDPIDFSGRVDRGLKTERVDIPLVTKILERAKAGGAGIRGIKPEVGNCCVHTDLVKGY